MDIDGKLKKFEGGFRGIRVVGGLGILGGGEGPPEHVLNFLIEFPQFPCEISRFPSKLIKLSPLSKHVNFAISSTPTFVCEGVRDLDSTSLNS